MVPLWKKAFSDILIGLKIEFSYELDDESVVVLQFPARWWGEGAFVPQLVCPS